MVIRREGRKGRKGGGERELTGCDAGGVTNMLMNMVVVAWLV